MYYLKDYVLPIDEDDKWEFKAHRNFSSDEVPAWRADGTKICPARAMTEFYKLKNANRTRQPISRNICGFLNSGKGGTILIGVLDSAKVVGINLSSLQKDHLLLSLEDALRRFKPRVPLDFVKVCFVPVIEDVSELQDIDNPLLCEPPNEVKNQPHQLRTSSLCWCDVLTMHRLKLGFIPTPYIVEVRIAALHPNLRTPDVARALKKLMQNKLTPLLQLSWPAFTSEDGNLFCRVLNSLVKYTEDEITMFNTFQTEDFLRNELSLLEKESDDKIKHKHLTHLQTLVPVGEVVNIAYLTSILQNAGLPSTQVKLVSQVPINDGALLTNITLPQATCTDVGNNKCPVVTEDSMTLRRTQSCSSIKCKQNADLANLRSMTKSLMNLRVE